jgi:predicted lysophospholipase L1 biosynthesis ABC-type transport system permease subunit
MVTAALAQRFWPGQSAIGRRIKGGSLDSDAPWWTIVGVLQDANLRGIPQNPTKDPDIFLPFNDRSRAFAVLMRTSGDPNALIRPAADALRQREPGVAIFNAQPMQALVDQQLSASRFLTWLTSVFAVTALTLAIIGIYGLLAYWVGQRTREIGVRAALGAQVGDIVALVLRQSLAIAGTGVAAGLVASFWLTGTLRKFLYGVEPRDALSFTVVAATLIAVAAIATIVPARRAARVDPVNVLR